ncbi:MAG: 3-phosphoserine/phosphohydroxythreonine transaminase [Deltaproteobacteria bacterium]|nr:3-phosphoserine/phosphohydroxythreonine transaminase [Deltaproteobacteria bacterium]
MARIHNFSAGPAVLPVPVLEQAREAALEYGQTGLGLMECSHRSPLFEGIIGAARERLQRLLALDDDQEVLFLQGGASSQFFMVPMNLLRGGRATYLDTGAWSKKAMTEARRFGVVDVPFSAGETGYDRVPAPGAWGDLPAGTVYLHYTSNNTIAGTQYAHVPDAGDALLTCDASSDICSRPLDGSRFDVLYAGAQKNLGPAGVTVVVVRRSILERCDPEIPTMLRYETHVSKRSMFNTPNTFGIFVIERACAWIEEDMGGLAAVGARNEAKANKIYGVIDESDFWQGKALRDSRSQMNVTFTTGDPDLDTTCWKAAAEEGLGGLKGHRSVGGLRASIYNAQTDEAIGDLIQFMKHFEQTRG